MDDYMDDNIASYMDDNMDDNILVCNIYTILQSPTGIGAGLSMYISLVWGKLRPCSRWRWKEGYFWLQEMKFKRHKTKTFCLASI